MIFALKRSHVAPPADTCAVLVSTTNMTFMHKFRTQVKVTYIDQTRAIGTPIYMSEEETLKFIAELEQSVVEIRERTRQMQQDIHYRDMTAAADPSI